MRVISGSARGRVLISPDGNRVRPTADRIKEALFSSLVSRFGSLEGLAILDLFAGSGALGIESLSRGAKTALFVDNHRSSLQLVRKNLDLTGLADQAEILLMDAIRAVEMLGGRSRRFDIVFADPPYAEKEIIRNLLVSLSAGAVIEPDGVVVLETGSKTDLLLPENLALVNRRIYGDTAVWMLATTD